MKRFLGVAGVSVFFLVFAFVMEADAGCFRRGGGGWGFPVLSTLKTMRENRLERVSNRVARRAARQGFSYSSTTVSTTVTATNGGNVSAPSSCASCPTNSVGYYDTIVNGPSLSPSVNLDCSTGVCVPVPAERSSDVWQPVAPPDVIESAPATPVDVPVDDAPLLDGVEVLIPDGSDVTSVRHRTACIWLE